MVNYEHNKNPIKPLTIEASFRRKMIPSGEITMINGISVYQIEPLCLMKATAYAARDKIRDLYDLSYICNNFFDELSSQTLLTVRNAIEYKGIEQYDYLVKQTKDELIDVVKLGDDFLKMYDKLGLLYDSGDKQIFDEVIQTKLADRCKKEAQQLQTPVPPHKRNDHER
jgi:predicted nucleotidyltransferase component of viral defense system